MILEAGKPNIKVLASGKGSMLHLHPDGGRHMAIELLRAGRMGIRPRMKLSLIPNEHSPVLTTYTG